LGPQGLRERVESVTLLPELAELGVHLVKGTVLVTGAVLELLPLADGNQ
jgi:2-keto-4-pentenoate hydratase